MEETPPQSPYRLYVSGKVHTFLPRTPLQAFLMSLTSASYLLCSAVWLEHDQPALAILFCCVCVASILADGIRVDSPWVRAADRSLAIIATMWSVWLNLKCPRSVLVSLTGLAVAVSFLFSSRQYGIAANARGPRPACYWGYLLRHGLLWHGGGAALLVFVTIYSHSQSEPSQ
jgi:hypothetical protein